MKERGLWTKGRRMVKEDICRSRQAGREALPGSLERLDSCAHGIKRVLEGGMGPIGTERSERQSLGTRKSGLCLRSGQRV